MQKRIRITAAQRNAVVLLRARLAEKGCAVFKVASWCRKHRLDFVAVSKDEPSRLLLVRPKQNGSLEVRAYCVSMSFNQDMRDCIKMVQKNSRCAIVLNARALPRKPRTPDSWENYLSRPALREFRLLQGFPLH